MGRQLGVLLCLTFASVGGPAAHPTVPDEPAPAAEGKPPAAETTEKAAKPEQGGAATPAPATSHTQDASAGSAPGEGGAAVGTGDGTQTPEGPDKVAASVAEKALGGKPDDSLPPPQFESEHGKLMHEALGKFPPNTTVKEIMDEMKVHAGTTNLDNIASKLFGPNGVLDKDNAGPLLGPTRRSPTKIKKPQAFSPPPFAAADFANGRLIPRFVEPGDIASARVTVDGGITVIVLYQPTKGGSRFTIIPPIDFAYDDQGALRVSVTDPETGCDYTDPSGRPLTTLELIRSGRLPKEVKITIFLHCLNELPILESVRWGSSRQMRSKAENWADAMTPARGPMPPAPIDLAIANISSLTIESDEKSHGGFSSVLDGNPVLGRQICVSQVVPAAFVRQLYSSAGVTFSARFAYPAFPVDVSEAWASDVVVRVANAIIDEGGNSVLRSATPPGSGTSEVKVLINKSRYLENLADQATHSKLVLDARSPGKLNTLLGILASRLKGVSSVKEAEINNWFMQTLGWEAILSQPSLVGALNQFEQDHKVTADLQREVHTAMNSMARTLKGGGSLGFGIPGKIFLGASGSRAKGQWQTDSRADLLTKDHIQDFAQARASAVQGVFHLAPSLNLELVAEQNLREVVNQTVVLAEPGDPTTYEVRLQFNSATPLLRPAAYTHRGPVASGRQVRLPVGPQAAKH
jgi:hypothetical protein